MHWMKSPYEWAKGKAGHAFIENFEMAEMLVNKGLAEKIVEKVEVKLLETPLPATFLFTPQNKRTFYKLFVKDLMPFYNAVGYLHGYYHG